jgi:hypothetical protein
VLTSEPSRCNYYQSESQNVQSKGNCSNPAFGEREEERREAQCLTGILQERRCLAQQAR